MAGTSHVLAARSAAENLLALSRALGGWSSRQDGYGIAGAGPRGCRTMVTCPPGDPDATTARMASLASENMPGSGFFAEDTFGTCRRWPSVTFFSPTGA